MNRALEPTELCLPRYVCLDSCCDSQHQRPSSSRKPEYRVAPRSCEPTVAYLLRRSIDTLMPLGVASLISLTHVYVPRFAQTRSWRPPKQQKVACQLEVSRQRAYRVRRRERERERQRASLLRCDRRSSAASVVEPGYSTSIGQWQPFPNL